MPIFTLRAFADASELSGFKCGIDVMDNFIRDGLTEELQSTGCDSYLLLDGDEIVAFFATCHDTLVLEKPIPPKPTIQVQISLCQGGFGAASDQIPECLKGEYKFAYKFTAQALLHRLGNELLSMN